MDYTEETIAKYAEYVNPATARLFRFMGLNSVEDRAEGWTIYDKAGRQFIDCLGGYGMFSVGHRHPKVIAAVKEALDTMPMCGKILFNRPVVDLAEKLASLAPGNLHYSFFVNSGAEAVEVSLKTARLATGRSKFIAMENAFHGKTFGALTATGRELFRTPFEPLLANFTHVPYGDSAALEAVVDEETAAVIVEPIQGEGGIIVPPAGYLKDVERICHSKGALFIADEVQTGLGRTGKMFGVEHAGAQPDIMALAKALGGGVAPIGACLTTPEAWEKMLESPFLQTSTFGGNQLSAKAALATLAVIEEEHLVEESASKGEYFLEQLRKLQADYPSVIADVRGRGLMLGLELTKEGAGGMLMALMIDQNIIIAYTLNNPKVIRLEPPLIMPLSVIEQVVAALRTSVAQIAAVIADL